MFLKKRLLPIQLLLGILMLSFANTSQKILDRIETKSGILHLNYFKIK